MSLPFDPYYTWLGIPPEEQPADYYRLLGVRRFETNEDVITNASDQRMSYIRTFQTGKRSKESQRILNELSAAQICLLNPEKRKAYDQQLRRHDAAKSQVAAPLHPAPVPSHTAPATLPARQEPSQPLPGIDPLTRPVASPLRTVVAPKPAALPPWVWIAGVGGVSAVLVIVIGVAANSMRRQTAIAASPTSSTSPQQATQPPPPPLPPQPPPASDVPTATTNVAPAAPIVPIVQPSAGPAEPMPVETPPTEPVASAIPLTEPMVAATIPGNSEPTPAPGLVTVTPTPAPAPVLPATAGASTASIPVTPSHVVDRIPLRIVSAHQAQISPDGRLLNYQTVGGRQPESEVLDLSTGEVRGDKILAATCAFSQDSQLIAMVRRGTKSDVLEVIPSGSAASGGISTDLVERGHAVAFSSNDRFVFVAGGRNPPLAAFDRLNNVQPASQFSSTLGEVRGLAVAGDALLLYSPSDGFEVISVSNPTERRRIEHRGNAFPQALALADGVPTLTFFHEKDAHVYRLGTEITKALQPIPGIDSHHHVLAISPEGDLAAVRTSGAVALYDLAQKRELTRLEGERTQVTSAAISKGRTMLVTGGPNKMLVVWDLGALLRQPRWQVPTPIQWAKGGFPAPTEPKRVAIASASRPQPNLPQPNPPQPRQPNQPPPQSQYNVAAARAAIATLREAGLQLSDDPEQVHYVELREKVLDARQAKVLAALPRLRQLVLAQCPSAALVLKEMDPLPGVEEVQLYDSDITDAELVYLKKLPKLRQLSLSGTKVTAQGLTELKHLPNLSDLNLPQSIDRDAVPILSQLPSLERLGSVPQGVTDADLAALGKLTKLKELNLYQAELDGSGLKHLQGLKGLTSIGLPPRIPGSSLAALSNFSFEHFYFPDSCGDAELSYFARMPNLRTVWTPPGLTDDGLKVLATYPALDTMFMSRCTEVKGRGFAHFAGSRTLRMVHLPEHVTDDALAHFAKCPALESLMLMQTHCTAASLPGLAPAPRLKSLSLGSKFGDDIFRHLKNFRALESLGLHGSTITAAGLKQLRECRQITELNFNQIPLGDPEVAALAQLPHVKRLMVQQHKLTPEQMKTLQTALPNCSISN